MLKKRLHSHFTARDGALKSGGLSRTTLTRGSLTTLNPSWGALKSGGLSIPTLLSDRRPDYTQR